MESGGQFKTLLHWKSVFLEARGLVHPDGRALYQYRVSDSEFVELERLLGRCIALFVEQFGLARIGKLQAFESLFVLYAAEWWRRRYDGTGFSWEPILRDLGAAKDAWTPNERSVFVKEGLLGWRIETRRTGALRFLGTVAVQGGLPLVLLSRARGGVGRLLNRVLRQARGREVTLELIEGWVESLRHILPKSYRRPEIFALLGGVVWTVLCLKKEADLQSSKDAIPVMDAKVPDWRDRFPLPVNDRHAQGIIEQLIRDAADSAPVKSRQVLPVERYLDGLDDGFATLKSRIVLPTHLSVNDLSRLFGVPEEKLPKQAELSLYAGDHTLTTAARRVCGRELYRLNQRSWEVPQDFACEEHTLRLSSPEGRVYSAQAEKGEALDEELPWVFVDHESEIRFLKQGSGKVSDEKAWIALGDIWKVEEGVCRTKTAEDLNGFGRKIIEVEGSVKAISTTGLKFGLKTGHVGADDEDFYWKGDRVWLDFKGPRIAFRGVPDLYKKSDEAISRKVTEDLAITSLGASGAGATIGPVVASYPKNGEVEFRSRALLLGPRASLRINPQDAKSGEIILEQWGAESARVCNEHVSQHQDRYGNDRIRISVGVPAGRAAPERLELEVLWKNSTVPSRLEIPFPARGARLFGPSGAELDSGSLIPSGSLIGTRMVLASARPGTSYDLELSNTSLDVKRRHKLSSIGEGEVREIRLQDYLDDVIQLLSADDSPDSQVEIRISEKGQIFFSFGVARYCTALDIQGSEVGVTSTQLAIEGGGDLSEIGLYAIRLQDPEDEPVRLPPALTEGVRTGNWRLDPIENEAGDWLVFPEGKAGKFIRPLLWSSPNELEAAGGLSAAVGKREQEQRMAAISECLDEMALDFFNDGWLFLERLYDHVSHLPLVTLDIWRCLAQHEDAMAAVSLRFGRVPTKMLERMPKELPTAWEVVSAASWRNSMERLSDQCQRLFGDNANAVLSSHLKDRLEFLQALCPPIAYLLGILSVKYLPEGKREAEIIRTVIGHYAEEALFFGAGSELMKLRRHHADDEWPNDAVSAFQRAPKAPTDAGVLHSFEPAYQNNVANLPALIACQVSRGETDYWLSSAGNISAIKSAQAFDPDWFEEAFSRTVARCYAEGILDNE